MIRIAVLVFLGLAASGGTPRGATPADPATPEVSYTRDVKPFLQKYCLECHNSSQAKAKVVVESVLTMTRAVAKKNRRSVIPGDADHSMLMQTLEGRAKKMPPAKYAHQPAEEEIKKLRAWIEGGARDDTK